jgi:hypothetical protein
MINPVKIRFLLLPLFFLLAACARENMRISSTAFYEKPKVLVGQMSGFEEAHFYKDGDQGWADMIINYVITSSANERLKDINIQPLLDERFYAPFQKILTAKTTWVKKLEKTIFKEDICTLSHEEQTSPYDFSFLKHQYDADFALIIDPHTFGSLRNYYGFIPLGAPVGVANFTIYFVRLRDNALFGLYKSELSMPVHGEWDAPPEYYELIQSIKNALTNGLSDAFGFLFPDGVQS